MPDIGTNYDLRPFFDHLYRKSEKRRVFSYRSDMPAERIVNWQRDLSVELSQVLGLPMLLEERGTLKAFTEKIIRRDGYVLRKERVNIAPRLDAPVYVLKPENAEGPLPAVFCYYGHGRGACDVLDLPDPCGFEGSGAYQKEFPLALVRRGFIVFVPEIAGFGELFMHSPWTGGAHKCTQPSERLLMFGSCMAGLRVLQAMRTVDYALTRSDVDAARMGCMGISGGGLLSSFHAALDTRMRAAVVSGYCNTFLSSIVDIDHCIDNYVPGILNFCEMPDIFSLIAPRALMISSGTEDRIFPIEAARRAYSQLAEVYDHLKARTMLACDFYEGGHEISGDVLYDFLQEKLI